MKSKILLITTTFPRWKDDKVPAFIFELARELTKKYDVHVLAPHSENSKTFEVMSGIKVHRFRYCFSKFENLSKAIAIYDALRQSFLNYLLIPLFVLSGFIKIFFLLFY